MSELWSTKARLAEPYVPGEQPKDQGFIKLNTNENPYPPSPLVQEAIAAEIEKLQLYPSPFADPLRETIARYYGLANEYVFVGNGSDEVLALAFMAFFEPGKTIRFPDITYSFYPVYAKLFDVPFELVPLNGDFTLSAESFIHSQGGVIFPNPNAPTGLFEPLEAIGKIAKGNRGKLVIIDEAYADFAPGSAIRLIEEHENLLVIQTASKSRSLAGLRAGFALGQPALIEALNRMKDSFNSYPVDRLAIAGAAAAFKDEDYFAGTIKAIKATRERAASRLAEIGFHVLPSDANFLFAEHPTVGARSIYEQLRERGILVRHFDSPRIRNFLRISIGTDEQMDALFSALASFLR